MCPPTRVGCQTVSPRGSPNPGVPASDGSLAAAMQNGDMGGLGEAVGSGLGGIGSSIGGLLDSFGRAVGGALGGAMNAALSMGPFGLVVGGLLVLFAVVFLLRALR